MGKTTKTAMTYERMPIVKSKQKDIDKTFFKGLTSGRIIIYGVRELYSRYSTELWALACSLTWAVILWSKLS